MVRPVVSTSTACLNATSAGSRKIFAEHFDHIFVGVIVIVEQHHVEQRREPVAARVGLDFRRDSRRRAYASYLCALPDGK